MNTLYKNLEFDLILQRVADSAVAKPVADELLKSTPTSDIKSAEKLLSETSDALSVLASRKPNLAFDDVNPFIEKAKVGAVLQPSEFLAVKKCITALRSLKSCVDETGNCDSLKAITSWARPCSELEKAIDNAIESDTEIKNSASEKLFSIRRSILRANSKLKERLDGFTRQSDISKFLRDNIVTVRGGRYVVPVRSECRTNVKGLVHDVSSTGATVFVEPFAVVEANNELITLKTEEQIEIERILAALTNLVVTNSDELVRGNSILTRCGVIFAKAEYAKRTDSYRPLLNNRGRIILKGARHPLIAEQSVVPVDITLSDKRVLLISGPNTGGKTVALKTVGLFALMSGCGMFIPAADGSEMCIFDDIYCDIGDSQSIAQSLSTFSAHIKNISLIMSEMNGRSLVLLDEVGDGTDPDEGAALAIAVLKKILDTGAAAVITTHFNAVKEFALGCDGIANACMQFDSINLRPTYKLLQGISGSSYALEIAERLGLDKGIINDAKAALSVEKVALEKIMREAEQIRNAAAADRDRCAAMLKETAENEKLISRIKSEYENKLRDINDNARTIIKQKADEYSEYAQELIDEIKEKLRSADETALFAARKTAKKLSESLPVQSAKPTAARIAAEPRELTDGTHVFISGLNKEGIIVGSVRGNKAVVAIGSVKTDVPVSALSVLIDEPQKKRDTVKHEKPAPQNIELMLLGATVDEATEQIDRILSDIPSQSTLRIVHGKGSGALGKGVQNYLKKQPRIKSYRYGRYGEGDTGVTIAEIK